jgi:hypothetical protein
MGPATPPYRLRRVIVIASLILTASLTHLPTRPGIAVAQVAADRDGECRLWSSITARFDPPAIGAGDTLWFSSVLRLTDAPHAAAVTVRFDQASVSYVANGATTTVAVPVGVVTFSRSATSASTSYDAGSGTWYTTVPLPAS